jgi:hypothetical protein
VLASGYVRLHADDGLDPGPLHLIVKRDGAIHIPVVSDGDGARADLLRTLRERLYLYGSVQETEIGMEMEVHKIFFVHLLLSRMALAQSGRGGPPQLRSSVVPAVYTKLMISSGFCVHLAGRI